MQGERPSGDELMGDPLDGLEVEVDVRLVRDGEIILDGRLAELLKAVSKTGSLLSAAKLLGIPYSKAWRSITSLERKLGKSVIAPRRGGRSGGGTNLTETGRKLLSMYERAEKRLGIVRRSVEGSVRRPDLLVAGSHDLLLENAIRELSEYDVEVHWIGSYGGILSILMGDSDLSGVHLLDPRTGEYNVPIFREFFPSGGASLLRGYDREVGWAFRRGFRFSEEDLLSGRATLANRNRGSGTRTLLDRLLLEMMRERGLEPRRAMRGIKGYDTEYPTHTEACLAVIKGMADVTLTILPVAEMYGLEFTSVGWERYDLVVRDGANERVVREILGVIKRIDPPVGYRIPPDFGLPIGP